MKYKTASPEDYKGLDYSSKLVKAYVRNDSDFLSLIICVDHYLKALDGDEPGKEINLKLLRETVSKHVIQDDDKT